MTDVIAAKKALVQAWKALPESDRRAFLGRLKHDLDFVPPNELEKAAMKHPLVQAIFDAFPSARLESVTPSQKDMELVIAMSGWRRVLNSGLDADQRGFALSIASQMKKPDWTPTEKQRAYMVALYQDKCGVDPEILEDGD